MHEGFHGVLSKIQRSGWFDGDKTIATKAPNGGNGEQVQA
jgi:hypothetical protein